MLSQTLQTRIEEDLIFVFISSVITPNGVGVRRGINLAKGGITDEQILYFQFRSARKRVG